MWIRCLQDLFCMILYSQKISQKIILSIKEVTMKKILLLLMAMFTFANCSFAENWVYTKVYDDFPVYTDIDSIKFNKNGVKCIQKMIDKTSGSYAKFYCTLNFDSNEFTMRGDLYNNHDIIVDSIPLSKTTIESYDNIFLVFLKTLYKYHKELLARNIVIVFEIIAILVLLMYIKRKQKDEKVVISEEKNNIEDQENN